MKILTDNIIYVRTPAQKALLEGELIGQITDGMWENSAPSKDQMAVAHAKIEVASPEQKPGLNFPMKKTSFAFNSSELFGIVGDRMVEMVRAVEPSATIPYVRDQLRDLTRIFKSYVGE